MDPELIAYSLYDTDPVTLETSSPSREWMNDTPNKFANRCLPLTIANASGWVVKQSGSFTATWNNSPYPGDITIETHKPGWIPTAHFGGGMLTWHIPWLFRTPPGWNLVIRGPINEPRDGVAPLEGVLETDWMTQSTTYSVKLTRPYLPVTYMDGENVAIIYPVRRDDLEAWRPVIRPMPTDIARENGEFARSRGEFNASDRQPRDWQRHYAQGKAPGGAEAPPGEHRKRRSLRAFTRDPGLALED